ncbi:hypothetical protein EU546_03025 [Candidatus Thorarchaeota archaeon]|nr:MAG: hypothetical protein EU546_03025 [Candidatus Thorarchaeota archaeon]
MNRTSRHVGGIAVLLVVLVSSIAVLVYLDSGSNSLEIRFVPDHLNTVPSEVGWFLIEIDTVGPLPDLTISIDANTSIETDYEFWEQTLLLEVFVYPNSSHIDHCIEIEATLSSGGVTTRDTAKLDVLNWSAAELPPVVEMRDVFVDFLSAQHAEFGVNDTVSWTPIYNGAGVLVVGHYLFRSDQWEMSVSWHVTIQPHDWAQTYLRHRSVLQPSWAGKIESWGSENHTVYEINTPETIYRAG